ncbi:hypothetical protein O1611_g3200 [Lasiodiplodia mahajangana]|uniref:Uncharacterized protein n=1 Tax=Lasiodiplodia mahajangana TaxID=1108764 RepID=A0ACC2JSG7_9PEZI|nr:hypothetical protein O1611_g3200 [Lasiodiplodia mahajangana]
MEPQAVIGFAFKLPQGVDDEERLWNVLQSGEDLSTEWPTNRANITSHQTGALNRNGLVTCRGYFLNDDPAAFDAPFFSINPQEAAAMDPQQRWILETAFHAFENAGISMGSLRGSRTAVYTGSMADDYSRLFAKDPDTMPRLAITGTSPSILANRVSWFFGLTGPSMHIDSACSSSLTALDLACQALHNGNASQALVIGSSVMLSPESSLLLSNMGFLSPDGRSYSFDHRANGYARGEGIVALVIKRFSAAIQDRDAIRAIIRSIGSNQDGRTPTLTQPSCESQEKLIREVYGKAGLEFESTRYVEAHGTGTQVGDPIEAKAIASVFDQYRSPDDPLYLGSIKSNIGHLEGGSGLAGVLKSILILEKSIIPPNALFEHANADLSAHSGSIVFPTTSLDWPGHGTRRVSVCSYGFGGSNCHAILDNSFDYIENRLLVGINNRKVDPMLDSWINNEDQSISSCRPSPENSHMSINGTKRTCSINDMNGFSCTNGVSGHTNGVRNQEESSSSEAEYPLLLVLSAQDESVLKRMIEEYESFHDSKLSGSKKLLAQLAYTLSARRSLMDWRAFAVVEASRDIKLRDKQLVSKPVQSSSGKNHLVMVFTGQGAQYAKMGIELLRFPVFENALRQANAVIESLGCEWSIIDALENENIYLPQYSQPLCTALQIALVVLLRSFGIAPSAVVGHSSGEIAAAYAIGALSLQSAMKVAYYRGHVVGKLKREGCSAGAMISVNLSADSVKSYLDHIESALLGNNIHIACVNSPRNCTLSGQEQTLDEVKRQLDKDGIFTMKLNTGVAYHSPTMYMVEHDYLEALGSLSTGDPTQNNISMVSSVTGALVSPEVLLTPQYWVDNLISRVKFLDAVQYLFIEVPDQSPDLTHFADIVEVGPHSTLRRPLQDIVQGLDILPEKKRPRYHSVLHKSKSALEATFQIAGDLFCLGYSVSITEVNQQNGKNVSILVNCPKYPFDHSRQYWIESRIAREYRFREAVPRDSLGTRVHDWNPLEPRWRNMISVKSMPWVGDHVLNDTVIFPGAGLLIMAVEAAKQAATSSRPISGFYIKEAHFLNPMLINDTAADATEAFTHLRPIQNAFDKESGSSEILIFAYTKSRWTECFRAVVRVQYHEHLSGSGKSQINVPVERDLEVQRIQERYQNALLSSVEHIGADRFYRQCLDNGFRYGESFKLLEDIRWDCNDTTVARTKAPWSSHDTDSFVHPAVLDSGFHLSLTQVSKGLSQRMSTLVPYQLFDTWVSATGWNKTSPMRLASFVMKASSSRAEATIYGLSEEDLSPLITMGRLVIASVSQNNTETADLVGEQRLIHKIDWKPQLSLQSTKQLHDLCHAEYAARDETMMITFYHQLESALLHVAGNVLSGFSDADLLCAPSHLKYFVSAIRRQVENRSRSDQYSHSLDHMTDEQAESILSRSKLENPAWAIFPVVAQNILPILRGEVDPLDLVFSTGLAESFYRSVFDQICDSRLRTFLSLASHENAGLRIFEVGAGTGGMTRHVLSALHDLERSTGTRRFQRFDAERDCTAQGVQDGTYDLVVAGSVLHATASLDVTLNNMRKLLKPGGRLVFLEIVTPESISANIGFGVLPGWWLGKEEYRRYSPVISEHRWDELLRQTGFSGTDLAIRDYQSDVCHISSIMVSTAITKELDPGQRGLLSVVVFVIDDERTEQITLANSLSDIFGLDNSKILGIRKLHNIKLATENIVVSLLEIGKPVLATLSQDEFQGIKHLVQEATNILWITASEKDARVSHYSLATGFLRTIRAEVIEKRIVTLEIEPGEYLSHPSNSKVLADYISQVVQASMTKSSPESVDVGYIVRNGHLSSARMVEDIDSDEAVSALVSPQLQSQPLGAGPPLVLTVGALGMLDTLRLVEDPEPHRTLGSGDVEIEARAWALSFRDVFVALGRLPDEELGWDCAGIVVRAGPDCNFQPGDRVGFGAPGSMRTHIRTASSTGQMAVWIAKHVGAEIFATVGTDEKKELLVERFGIPASHIFYSRNTDFAQGVKRLTNGRGVDVVLNSLSGDSLRASWDCVAPYGRFVEIGKADITANSNLPMANFMRNVSFFAVDLHHIAHTNLSLMADLMRKVLNLLKAGAVQYPYPRHVFTVAEIEKAFRLMQSGNHTGRILISVEKTESVPMLIRTKLDWKLDENASYLVVGGLGGLGRSICKWMADKGARYLILPSRSGATSEAASKLIKELNDRGVHVATPVCDASSYKCLSAAIDDCARSMAPVRGCINAAMSLQDAAFETMSHAQWEVTIRSKVDTSWNLHQLLPPGTLDFFILLSSLSGLYGSIAQSNYAAGCTFQDALAQYRSGICADNNDDEANVSLDIGWMRNIGRAT